MKKSKIITAVLIIVMALQFASCGGESPPEPPDTFASGAPLTESANSIPEDEIPPEASWNFEGKTFRIMNGYADATKYINNLIYPEEMTGEALEDAMYMRCAAAEDRLGCTIEVTPGDINKIKNNITAGDDFADLTMADLSNVMSLVSQKYCADFYDIPNIDLSKRWWDHNAEKKLSFDGRLYYTFNDIVFTHTDNARAVYFNKEVAASLNMENFYTLVTDGKWTIDKMNEHGLAAVSDLNGDSVFDKNDRWGVINWGVVGLGEALLTGCESEIVNQGDDGIPYFNCFGERFQTIYTKVLDFMTKDNMFLIGNYNLFIDGHSLFLVDSFFSIKPMRSMETDFGILPLPKYDEVQEKYWNVSPNPHALIIPVTAADTAFVGAAIEELAYQSYCTVLPAYYEGFLKTKGTRDDESAEMLDLIHDGISYVIKIIGTKFSDSIYNEMSKKNFGITSFLESNKTAVETELQTTLSQFQ